ncbi:MAG TPA: hypothetical protein VFJ63_02675 [Candidatus Bathyarchaeia archaeon]|nr:hypothetical protein [Candidatus Bathyarchaeia archaeon]
MGQKSPFGTQIPNRRGHEDFCAISLHISRIFGGPIQAHSKPGPAKTAEKRYQTADGLERFLGIKLIS